MYICNCYIPPETSEIHKISGAPYFEILNEEVIKFSTQGDILLLGDMNSRTGERKEHYTEIDEDITVRDQLCVEDITSSDRVVYCLPDRKNEDMKANSFGRNLISITEQAHLAIVNGRKLGDLRGKTTCVTYNGMSTVDYCIVSTTMFDDVIRFSILDQTWYSDHIPCHAASK